MLGKGVHILLRRVRVGRVVAWVLLLLLLRLLRVLLRRLLLLLLG